MLRKNFLYTVFILLSLSALGGAIFYHQSLQKQQIQSPSAQNDIGEQRNQPQDSEEVTPPQQLAEATKSGAANTPVTSAAPTAAPSAPRTGGNNSPANNQQPASSDGVDPLRSQIEQKYTSRLQALASGYEGKVNGLINSGINEYRSAQKDNPNADIGPIMDKYYAKAKALEAECDAQFYSILGSFEEELKANSFPLDAAVNAKNTYEARKGAKAGQLSAK